MSTEVILGASAASTSGVGVDWFNQSGAYQVNNASPATVSVSLSAASKILGVSGMAANQLPSDAEIVGISWGGQAWADATGATFNYAGCDINGKMTSASFTGVSIGTTTGTPFGGGSDTTIPAGLETVTAADVNTGSMSVGLSVVGPSGGIANVKANDMGIIVWYIESPPPDPFPAGYVSSYRFMWPHLAM